MIKWLTTCTGPLLALTLLAGGAQANSLQLVGEARLKVAFWSIYHSRLYTADGDYREGQRPLKLEIEYLRDISAQDLVDATRDEWDHLEVKHGQREDWLAELRQLLPDVDENDVLALEVDSEDAHHFTLNGERLGAVSDPEFSRHFLAIWLSERTSRPKLRAGLTGQ